MTVDGSSAAVRVIARENMFNSNFGELFNHRKSIWRQYIVEFVFV